MKLYLVGRSDLPAGLRAAQIVHAQREFAHLHPQLDAEWFEKSNVVVLLEAANESALSELMQKASEAAVPAAPFHEPDMGGCLTALALAPSGAHLVRRLPLAYSAR